MKTLLLSTAILILAGAGVAAANECTGISARTSAAPIVVHKVDDGAVTTFGSSTGTSMILTSATGEAQNWQNCSGFWVTQPDGSGAGHGNCYAIDSDGDYEIVSWEGANGKGTWAHVGGTGKYEGRTSKGTWWSGKRFPGGLGVGHWKGTCG